MRRNRFRLSPFAGCALALLCAACGDTGGDAPRAGAALALRASAPEVAPGGPPPGRYVCWIRGAATTEAGGFRLLPGGRYQPAAGRGGRYGYDAEARTLSFGGGVFASYGWAGLYLAPEGAGAAAGETVVLRDRADRRAPGTEGAGEFHYCHRSTHPDDL